LAKGNEAMKLEPISLLVDDADIQMRAEVYYCTQNGKVKGVLKIAQKYVFFEPETTAKENKDFC